MLVGSRGGCRLMRIWSETLLFVLPWRESHIRARRASECMVSRYEPDAPASAWFPDTSPTRQRVHSRSKRATNPPDPQQNLIDE